MAKLSATERDVFFEEILNHILPKLTLKVDKNELDKACTDSHELVVWAYAVRCRELTAKKEEIERLLEKDMEAFKEELLKFFNKDFVKSEILNYQNEISASRIEEFNTILAKKVYCMRTKPELMKYDIQEVRRIIRKEVVLADRPKGRNSHQFLADLKKTVEQLIIDNKELLVPAEPGKKEK